MIKYLLLHKIDGISTIRVCVYTHTCIHVRIYIHIDIAREIILKSIIKIIYRTVE